MNDTPAFPNPHYINHKGMVDEPDLLRQFAAESAYRMADAMMKARETK